MIFTYRTHVNLLFGHGTAEQIGKETAKYGKKAMIDLPVRFPVL